jgi:hypothetical protein
VSGGAIAPLNDRAVPPMEPEAKGASRQLWVSFRRLPSELFPVSVGP